nr:hypothetical protein [Candidatus Moranbacteria bacterium]
TGKQVAELFSSITSVILSFVQSLTFEQVNWLIRNKKQLANAIRDSIRTLLVNVGYFSGVLFDWQNFYREVFGIETDSFSDLVIPAKLEGFDRLLIIAEGMTPQKLYSKCVEMFPSWKWTDRDLDEIVTSDRTAKNGAYAVWVRERVEADEELKNLSANQFKERGVPGITLEERLIYELKYFKETGEHLDINNVTLCAGSRCGGGHVPFVGFRSVGRGVGVDWAVPNCRDDHLRSRQVVST